MSCATTLDPDEPFDRLGRLVMPQAIFRNGSHNQMVKRIKTSACCRQFPQAQFGKTHDSNGYRGGMRRQDQQHPAQGIKHLTRPIAVDRSAPRQTSAVQP